MNDEGLTGRVAISSAPRKVRKLPASRMPQASGGSSTNSVPDSDRITEAASRPPILAGESLVAEIFSRARAGANARMSPADFVRDAEIPLYERSRPYGRAHTPRLRYDENGSIKLEPDERGLRHEFQSYVDRYINGEIPHPEKGEIVLRTAIATVNPVLGEHVAKQLEADEEESEGLLKNIGELEDAVDEERKEIAADVEKGLVPVEPRRPHWDATKFAWPLIVEGTFLGTLFWDTFAGTVLGSSVGTRLAVGCVAVTTGIVTLYLLMISMARCMLVIQRPPEESAVLQPVDSAHRRSASQQQLGRRLAYTGAACTLLILFAAGIARVELATLMNDGGRFMVPFSVFMIGFTMVAGLFGAHHIYRYEDEVCDYERTQDLRRHRFALLSELVSRLDEALAALNEIENRFQKFVDLGRRAHAFIFEAFEADRRIAEAYTNDALSAARESQRQQRQANEKRRFVPHFRRSTRNYTGRRRDTTGAKCTNGGTGHE